MVALPRLAWVSPAVIRRLAAATLIGNIVLVVTGGAVRLTGSGLGCPTWPSCTEDSFVPTPGMPIHSDIEWANRALGAVLGLVALATLLAVLVVRAGEPRRKDLIVPAAVILLGIPGQAVIGGITVLTDLNPWVVMLHFLLSMVLVGVATALWVRSGRPAGPTRVVVHPTVQKLGWALLAVAGVVLVLGTVVTGSGPHAGDPDSPRNGLDPAVASQIHADAVFLLVGLTIALAISLRVTDAPRHAQRAAIILLCVELAQGVVGYVQYFTDLPEVLVGVHLLGAATVVTAATAVVLSAATPEVQMLRNATPGPPGRSGAYDGG